jgi:hypothetical protein
MKTELEAGPELDAAVARAIGLNWKNATRTTMSAWYYPDDSGHATLPEFSEDLNAAFEAAEKCGLFAQKFAELSFDRTKSEWRVYQSSYASFSVAGPTAAVAICRAILRLSELPSSLPPSPAPTLQP